MMTAVDNFIVVRAYFAFLVVISSTCFINDICFSMKMF